MNSIIGRQIQHRKSLSCQSALSQYNNVANKFSKVFSYCENKMSLPEKRSKGFEKGVGAGLAIAELFLNRKHDLLNGDIDIRLWEFNSFIFDYTARDIWDFTDCKYFWGQYYSDKASVIASYPEAEEKIRANGRLLPLKTLDLFSASSSCFSRWLKTLLNLLATLLYWERADWHDKDFLCSICLPMIEFILALIWLKE